MIIAGAIIVPKEPQWDTWEVVEEGEVPKSFKAGAGGTTQHGAYDGYPYQS